MVNRQHQEIRDPAAHGSLKRCTKCGEWKPADREHFGYEQRYGGSLTAQCRACRAASCLARYYANREARLAARRNDLEGKAKVNARRREQRAADPAMREKNRVRCLEYAARNREAAAQRAREWAASNPEKVEARNARRAALLAAAGPGYSKDDVLAKVREQGYRCTYCGTPLKPTRGGKFHVDHIIPISKGGRHDPSNICCTCPRCNRSKHDRLPGEFLADLKAGRV